MLKKIDVFFQRYSYLIFLFALVTWIGLSPILESFINTIAFDVTFLLIIDLSAFYFLYESGRKLVALILVPINSLSLIISLFIDSSAIQYIDRTSSVLLFLLITIHMITLILKSKKVNENVIYASISGYVLIGLMASVFSHFLHKMIPNAYNMEASERIMDYVYISIVTMSTLGYGDITPQVDASKALAIFITLIGQFYMTVLVALLVGKFLNQRN